MKIIRAERDIHVPQDPENPDKYLMRSVQKGLIALVPENFVLDPDSYTRVGRFKIDKKKKNDEA